MRARPLPLLAALFALLLSACATTGQGGGRTAGGAVAGGLIAGLACAALGGNTRECAAVAAAGALTGGLIGNRMDARDRARRDAALQRAIADEAAWTAPAQARPVRWNNPDTGGSGAIQPVAVVNERGRDCRRFTERYQGPSGEPLAETRTVCRQADGRFA